MEKHIVKILDIAPVTHNVNRYTVEKPPGYHFIPGQATDLSINKPELVNEKRSFTFTSLNNDENLEFTIKSYTDHEGVTKAMLDLKQGDELEIGDVWGAISYKGPGYFIAGGAGVTPFIAILRDLFKKNKLAGNKLFFSNQTRDDIILKDEFEKMLGNDFLNVITDEGKDSPNYIDKDFLLSNITDFNKYFYICGPPPMMNAMEKHLNALNVDKNRIVKEEF